MRRGLLIFAGVFALLYAAAVMLSLIGTYGWFGQARDPLSAVFLLPLGLPWNNLTKDLVPGSPQIVAFAAPALNLAIILAVARWLGRTGTRP